MEWEKNKTLILFLCTLFGAFLSPLVFPAFAGNGTPEAPALDPPRAVGQNPASSRQVTLSRVASPLTEWTLHKTTDGSHPDGREQQMLWLMNRARVNPAREGVWLATSTLADVAGGRDYFGVDTQLLREEFCQIAVKPPAAFDVRLYDAAEDHCQSMIARDTQDHDGQFQAIADSGFSFQAARGNVYFYARSALNAHAAFNIDWGGSDGTGMQPGRGHRMGIMAMDGDYTNVGLAVTTKPDGSAYNGYYAVTGNYCNANPGEVDHFNRFLVGTVWDDLNGNEMYDPGEGLADIHVTPDRGAYYAVTSEGGGYAIPITTAGAYDVTFSGDALGGSYTRSTTLGGSSVLLDLSISDAAYPDDPGAGDTGTNGSHQDSASAAETGGGGGCFISILR